MAAMLPDGRRLGPHLALRYGMVKAADRAIEIGASAVQIFSDNPTAWRRRTLPSPEISEFRRRLAEAAIDPIAIHASYLINLAGADAVFHERSIALLTAELRTARVFGARIVNVHIGSHGGAGVDAGIARLVEAIRRAIDDEGDPEGDADGDADAAAASTAPPTITLENSSGGGFGLGVDVDELVAIADALETARVPRDRVAFCLDTAHAWGAGHDLSDTDAIDRLLEDFDRRIGVDRLPLIHLNDSRFERGSRLDRHQHVGAGRIGERGMAHLLRHPCLAGATYIVETPGMEDGYDAINLARAVALHRGDPLAPLPPGALTLRGSRARAATLVEAPEPGLEPLPSAPTRSPVRARRRPAR
jgi:deoxyribonuclease-4